MYLSTATFIYHNGPKGKTRKKKTAGSARKRVLVNTSTKQTGSSQSHGGCGAVRSPYSRIL